MPTAFKNLTNSSFFSLEVDHSRPQLFMKVPPFTMEVQVKTGGQTKVRRRRVNAISVPQLVPFYVRTKQQVFLHEVVLNPVILPARPVSAAA